jgi:myosin heavy subunit
VDGFVEKNMETLSNELRDLGGQASIDLSRSIYAVGSNVIDPSNSSQRQYSPRDQATQQRSSIRGVSVSTQFRSSLQSLVNDLEQTQPHYIRCIKPNHFKHPALFSSGEVLKQLRYSGMMEAIRIRREGYAFREGHDTFYNRLRILLTSEELNAADSGVVQLVNVLSKRLHVTDADWQIGHSKIFLRKELSDKLERLVKLRIRCAARTISRFGRRVALRRLAGVLVAWVRFRLHMIRKYRRVRSATVIAAFARRNKQRVTFVMLRQRVILVQSVNRRRCARAITRKMRDPYCDKNYKECIALLGDEEARLQEAVKSRDFRAAAEAKDKM